MSSRTLSEGKNQKSCHSMQYNRASNDLLGRTNHSVCLCIRACLFFYNGVTRITRHAADTTWYEAKKRDKAWQDVIVRDVTDIR